MLIQFAICDDQAAVLAYVADTVEQWAQQHGHQVAIDRFASAEALWFQFHEKKYDLLPHDIEMTGLNGVSLAKKIRRENEAVQIIFITGYADYIAEGYEVAALHYLLKPLDEVKFYDVLARAVTKIQRNERVLMLEMGGVLQIVPFYDIQYVEVDHNYVTVHGKQAYTVKKTLAEIERELDERFVRTSRSFVVNLSFVRRISRKEVFLTDGTALPLSRGNYEKINRKIIEM